jgi:hypothetical protein
LCQENVGPAVKSSFFFSKQEKKIKFYFQLCGGCVPGALWCKVSALSFFFLNVINIILCVVVPFYPAAEVPFFFLFLKRKSTI